MATMLFFYYQVGKYQNNIWSLGFNGIVTILLFVHVLDNYHRFKIPTKFKIFLPLYIQQSLPSNSEGKTMHYNQYIIYADTFPNIFMCSETSIGKYRKISYGKNLLVV